VLLGELTVQNEYFQGMAYFREAIKRNPQSRKAWVGIVRNRILRQWIDHLRQELDEVLDDFHHLIQLHVPEFELLDEGALGALVTLLSYFSSSNLQFFIFSRYRIQNDGKSLGRLQREARHLGSMLPRRWLPSTASPSNPGISQMMQRACCFKPALLFRNSSFM